MSAHDAQEHSYNVASRRPDPSFMSAGVFLLLALLSDIARFLRLWLRPSAALAAENLVLRTQLALYQERQVTPRRATDAIRFTLVWLAQWSAWQPALAVVQPETFTRWRRQRYQLFRCWSPGLGRPPIPVGCKCIVNVDGDVDAIKSRCSINRVSQMRLPWVAGPLH
jgi:hypothetical protein